MNSLEIAKINQESTWEDCGTSCELHKIRFINVLFFSDSHLSSVQTLKLTKQCGSLWVHDQAFSWTLMTRESLVSSRKRSTPSWWNRPWQSMLWQDTVKTSLQSGACSTQEVTVLGRHWVRKKWKLCEQWWTNGNTALELHTHFWRAREVRAWDGNACSKQCCPLKTMARISAIYRVYYGHSSLPSLERLAGANFIGLLSRKNCLAYLFDLDVIGCYVRTVLYYYYCGSLSNRSRRFCMVPRFQAKRQNHQVHPPSTGEWRTYEAKGSLVEDGAV